MAQKIRMLSQAILASLTPDNWQSLKYCDVLLVCHDNNRGYTYHNRAYAQLLDSLGDLLKNKGLTTQTIATPFSLLTGWKAYGEPVGCNRAMLFILLKSQAMRLVWGREKRISWAEKQQENIWKKILDRSRSRVVIGIQPDSALCRAGHAQAVSVYDLQHGEISERDLWYGKEFREKTEPQDLPNGFLCWDKTSAANLEKWTHQKGISVHIVGNPWFRRFFACDPDDLLVQQALALEPLLGNERSTILVSLQWGMTQHFGEYVSNGVMPDALEKTILKTAKSYNWLLRLHPVQIRGPESELVQNYLTKTFGHLDRVEWRQCSEVPLPLVLKWSNLHMTYSSTTTTEAAWMGLYTGLLNPEIRPGGKGDTYYSDERSLGIAETLPLDSLAIEAWIKSSLTKGKAKSTFIDRDANLEAFINEISKWTQLFVYLLSSYIPLSSFPVLSSLS